MIRAALLTCLLAGSLTGVARGEPMWTTYHRDPGRSGYDSEAGEPVTPALDWQSPKLDGAIWGQPLVLGSRVYVATIADGIYALEASTGHVIWHVSAGTPVPSEKLPCGDVGPTVGIVGTPVIDTTTKAIYAVADTWNESEEAHHVLKGYSLSEGKEVLSTPVDPPGAEPTAYLQRTALNLDSGRVVFGFGGNDGDCANYQGAVVAAPENGEKPIFWQYKPIAPSFSGGAVWGTSGPIVDGAGEIYAATGNPNSSGGEITKFDDSDALLRLNPATDLVSKPSSEPAPLGWFEPPTWKADSNSDTDLGSAGPELLPGGMIFQAGKNGNGYLLGTTMSGETPAAYEGPACNGASSFGGDAFAGGVIYVACTNGVQALSYDQSKHTFTPLWSGPSEAVGPPIVAGGLVWVLATAGFSGGETLYGLDPATGKATHTETLPSPVVDHFASPSAAGGRLFVSTGESVTAYQIAKVPAEGAPPEPEPSGGTSSGSEIATASAGGGSPVVTSTGAQAAGVPTLVHTHLRANAKGRVGVTLRCPAVTNECRGTVTLLAEIAVVSVRGKRHVRRVVPIRLARARFGPHGGELVVILQLSQDAEAHLRRHHYRLALQVVIASPGSGARRVAAVLR